MVGLQYGTSLVSKPQKMTAISGYSWLFDNVLRPEDARKSIEVLSPFSSAQQTSITDFCRHPGLLRDYSERYPRPRTLPDNKVYIRLLFEVVGGEGDKALAETFLSGCVDRQDLDLSVAESSTVLEQLGSTDLYTDHSETILPGERMQPFRQSFQKWWVRVLRTLQAPLHRRRVASLREELLGHCLRQSSCYRSFLQTDRAKCSEEALFHEKQALQTGRQFVADYVDSLSEAGWLLLNSPSL